MFLEVLEFWTLTHYNEGSRHIKSIPHDEHRIFEEPITMLTQATETETQTNLDRIIAADADRDDEPFCLACDPLPEKRGRRADPESRRFNQALHRIIRGKYDVGGVAHELSVITGLSPEAIRSRVDSIEWDAPPEPLEPGMGLTSDDRKYFGKAYGRLNDPEVREFLQRINGSQRKDPDHENARVKRQRIGNKMISICTDIERN